MSDHPAIVFGTFLNDFPGGGGALHGDVSGAKILH